MQLFNWLQLFADGGAGDGGAEGGGEGTATGDIAPDPQEDRAKEMGIPAEYRKTFAKANSKAQTVKQAPAASAQPEEPQNEEAQTEVTNTEDTNQSARKSLREMIKDDEALNKEVQALVQDALRGRGKDLQAKLNAANKALAAVAPKYNIDTADMDNIDYSAFEAAAGKDESIWEERANEMGVSVEQARQLQYAEQARQREAAEQRKADMQAEFQRHFEELRSQASEVERDFAGQFSFERAIRDPEFNRLTRPGGLNVRQAFLALHGDEAIANSSKAVAAGVQKKMANAIASGSNRPVENGTQSQAQSVQRFDYAHMTPAQRKEFLRYAQAASARGEPVYLK